MIASTPENVPAYISEFPAETKKMLKQLRSIIKENAPNAEEIISYKMPAYKYLGMLVYFAGYQHHIGFYPGASTIAAFQQVGLNLVQVPSCFWQRQICGISKKQEAMMCH